MIVLYKLLINLIREINNNKYLRLYLIFVSLSLLFIHSLGDGVITCTFYSQPHINLVFIHMTVSMMTYHQTFLMFPLCFTIIPINISYSRSLFPLIAQFNEFMCVCQWIFSSLLTIESAHFDRLIYYEFKD